MPESGTGTPWREYALLGLLSLLWGSSFLLIKLALHDIPPATLAVLRTGLGGLALLALARWRGLRLPHGGRAWGPLLGLGVLQGALPFSLIGWSERHIDSGLAGVLNATVPLFVFVITAVVQRRSSFAWLRLAGVLLGLGGVVTLAGAQTLVRASGAPLWPMAAVLGASASYAVGALLGHRVSGQPPIVTAAGSLLAGCGLLLPVACVLDLPWTLSPGPVPSAAALALALLCTAVASALFHRLIGTLGPLATTSNAYLRAVVSVVLGAVILGEPLGWPMLSAMAMIFVGVACVTRPARAPVERST